MIRSLESKNCTLPGIAEFRRRSIKTKLFLVELLDCFAKVHTTISRRISVPFWLGTRVAAGRKESFCRNEVLRAKDESKICISSLITLSTRHDFLATEPTGWLVVTLSTKSKKKIKINGLNDSGIASQRFEIFHQPSFWPSLRLSAGTTLASFFLIVTISVDQESVSRVKRAISSVTKMTGEFPSTSARPASNTYH